MTEPNEGRSCLQSRLKNVVILGRVSSRLAGKVVRSTVADVSSQPMVRTLFSRNYTPCSENSVVVMDEFWPRLW